MSLWSGLGRVFDFGGQWGSATVRLVEGSDASLTLKKVESMLEDSMTVLKSHERLMNSRQYTSFSIKHRRLLLKVVEVKRGMQDQKTRNAFSAASADRLAYHSEVAQLQGQTEIFHRDVITASRRAQIDEENRFLAAAEEAERSPDSTWYSIITPQRSSSSDTESGTISDDSTFADREPFVAVAHVRERSSSGDSLDSLDDDSYRRILIMENKEKRMIMIDPNPCRLDKEADPMNESTLVDMSRAGETLLRVTEPDNLIGYESVGKSEEPSWIDSLIDTMASRFESAKAYYPPPP
ncbi:unnamed protein product [Rhizoctonia solani]|uniref:Uncharacterized protein n=1 Tax=Rhizoctonia solani TaxID=456999 RepID=A0A8H3GPJ4_9AGAM|nr:unnamed protein product [Rhizoctonia solani]